MSTLGSSDFSQRIDSFFSTADRVLGFVPVVSAFTNLFNLVIKAAYDVSGASLPHYFSYIQKKDYKDCALLIIPGINICVSLYKIIRPNIALLIKKAMTSGISNSERIQVIKDLAEIVKRMTSSPKWISEGRSVIFAFENMMTFSFSDKVSSSDKVYSSIINALKDIFENSKNEQIKKDAIRALKSISVLIKKEDVITQIDTFVSDLKDDQIKEDWKENKGFFKIL